MIKCLLTQNRCYKVGQKMKVKGICVHSTGANNPWLKRYVQPTANDQNYDELIKVLGKNRYSNSWNRSNIDACVHYFIGKQADGEVEIAQTLPSDMRGWHAGSGKKGSANDGWISFEICEDDLTDKEYCEKTYQKAVELCVELCRQYSLNPLDTNVIICHQDAYKLGIGSNHADIYHWWNRYGKTMEQFRKDIAAKLETTMKTVTASVLNVRSGPSTDYDIIGQLKNGDKVTVDKEEKGWSFISGWISSDWIK